MSNFPKGADNGPCNLTGLFTKIEAGPESPSPSNSRPSILRSTVKGLLGDADPSHITFCSTRLLSGPEKGRSDAQSGFVHSADVHYV